MDKKSLLGFLLIAVIMFGWMWFTQPSKEELAEQKRIADSLTIANADTSASIRAEQPAAFDSVAAIEKLEVDTALARENYGTFAPLLHGNDTTVTLENDLIKVKISAKGGRITYVELKKYKTYDSNPLVLVDEENSHFGYSLSYEGRVVNSSLLYFTPMGGDTYVIANDSSSVSFRLNIGEGKYIEHIYSLKADDYMVGFNINMVGLDQLIPRNISYIDLNWDVQTKQLERQQNKQSAKVTRNITSIYYKYLDEDPEFISTTKESSEKLTGKIRWVAFKQHFFNQTLISNDYFIRGYVEAKSVEGSLSSKYLSAILSFPFQHKAEESYNLSFYFGPNHFKTLKSYGIGLERQIFLGKGILRWVNTILVIPLFNFFSKFLHNYGIIILLVTFIIKMFLLPLTYRSYLSTAKMKLLKPELDIIKEKVGKDAAKQQTEQMKLYKQAGVSPLGGCLPMILQMPILIALFRFFPSSIELRQQGFLWAHDLSTYDSIYTFANGFKIPGYGDHISLFTLLMTVSTIIYTKMNSSMMAGDQAKQMKIVQYIMPIMFLGFFNNYSAGLSYYYFLANIITFGQQYLFKFFINEDKLRKKIELNKKKKSGKPKSRWQKKLENMQKQQRAVQKKR